MKNIHVLPKNIFKQLGVDHYGKTPTQIKIAEFLISKHIYITNDEEIKHGDCFIGIKVEQDSDDNLFVIITPKNKSQYIGSGTFAWVKKIILTTDQDLDGVQPIDDEFLEWFVKNRSCEWVEVKEKQHFEADKSKRINPLNGVYYSYKIIIPQEEPIQLTVGKEFYESADKNITVYKQDIIQLIEDRILSEYKKHSASLPNEWAKIAAYKIYKSISDKMEEPKQETIEKAAKNYTKNEIGLGFYPDIEIAFEKGVKWQAEQDREEIGLLQIELNHTKTLLQSCEKALEERDNQDERRYSDEEVMNALHSVELKYNKDFTKIYEGMKEWFKQFKKK